MFDNLRHAFREALENFNKELARDQVPETVDKLLAGMRDEVSDAKVRLKELEDQVVRAESEAAREQKEAATARRRGKLAADIEDTETAALAVQYAKKHDERHRVLEQKATALKDEIAIRRREIDEMIDKVKEAQTKRDSLTATTGRTEARESLGAADDLFRELDRMAEKIGDESARGEAAESMSDFDLHVDIDEPPPPPIDVDSRLEELKRRMGENS